MTDTPSPHPVAPAPATADELLEVYDTHLREGEMLSADSVAQVGPVLVGRYGRSRGFISYRDLGGLDASGIADLVAEVVTPLQADPDIHVIEWKTRGHDHAPGLEDALRRHGLEPRPVESVMLGEASGLLGPLPPEGVTVRRVEDEGGPGWSA